MTKPRAYRSEYNTTTAQQRYLLYRAATEKLKSAFSAGFYIEAIAIIESLITDRLHARYSHLKGHSLEARGERSFGKLLSTLQAEEHKTKLKELHKIYGDIDRWRLTRNRAVHDAVKLNDGVQFLTFDERYKEAEQAAKDGKRLFNALKAELDRIKRKDNLPKLKNN